MNYARMILEMLQRIKSEKILKRIYTYICAQYFKGGF